MKPIAGYEGLYSITDDGEVYSHERPKLLKNWKNKGLTIHGLQKERWLKKGKQNVYFTARLCKEGVCKTFLIHRLVAFTYLKKVNNKHVINHKNGIKTDNRASNLEWCTPKENVRHSIACGTFHYNVNKFNNKIQKEIISKKKSGLSIRSLAKIYKCSYGLIQKITGIEVKKGKLIYPSKIPNEDYDKILKMREEGKFLREIAQFYNCSLQNVHHYLKRGKNGIINHLL